MLRIVPTHFLPVLVADYLAVHFAVYGILTAGCLWWVRRAHPSGPVLSVSIASLAVAIAAAVLFGFVGIVWAINSFVTSFWPGPERSVLLLAMLAGTLPFFLATEWLTHGPGTGRGAYLVSKLAFLASLAGAVTLDFERLFFLIIIVPVMIVFLLVYGTFSTWIYRSTGHPFVAGTANAVAFAWALGVTFPLLAG